MLVPEKNHQIFHAADLGGCCSSTASSCRVSGAETPRFPNERLKPG
jgi:hypothetical protein